MKIRQEHEYAHDTETVFALFTDEQEITARQAALGARNIRIEACETDSGGAVVRFVRELPADVPGVLSKFLQPWNTVEQSERWHSPGVGRYEADIAIDVANVPVSVSGKLTLEPAEGGCINHVRVTVDCGIPFVGKTLAEFVAKDCERIIGDEYEYLCNRLDNLGSE
jgi:hypothetical protein